MSARRLENRGEHSFGQRVNIVRRDERRFDVDLGEFRLAIGAQIFVAKTFCDLKIFFHPGDHEQLLVLLRRLRQRVKFPRRQPAGNEKIARAFRRALRKNRRFDFEETLRVEIIARRFGDAMTQAQIARKLRPAQIEVAISQPQIFVVNSSSSGNGRSARRDSRISNFVGHHLDIAGRQLRIFRARANAARPVPVT